MVDLRDRVGRDPKLSADEKETTITMYGGDKSFSIYSAKPTVVKSLLAHDHFTLERARVLTPDGIESYDERAALEGSVGTIAAVTGEMPIGTLTVKSKPRTTDHQSSIVNAETVDPSVFQ
jgi:hypothetical protein